MRGSLVTGFTTRWWREITGGNGWPNRAGNIQAGVTLHHQNLPASDIAERGGYRITTAVDPNRLRTSVAFERFLARLFHDHTKHWVLKGGHALELRYPARATRGLDPNVPPPPFPDQRVLLAD